MIERSDAPAAAADVARPPRREWPAYLLGSKPAAIAARVGLALDHGLEVGDDRGCLCKLARAVGALDAGERFPDRSGPRIQLVPGGPVSGCNCHQVTGKGAGAQSGCVRGQIALYGLEKGAGMADPHA